MIKEMVLNGKRIEYDLQRKNVKNINLRIKADRTIFLFVAADTSSIPDASRNTRSDASGKDSFCTPPSGQARP